MTRGLTTAFSIRVCRICTSSSYPSAHSRGLPETLTVPHLVKKTSWNPNVHHRVQNSPPLLPILTHTYIVHALQSYFFNTHFNIIILVTFKFPKRPPSFSFSRQNPVRIFLHHMSLVPPNNLAKNTNHEAPHYVIFSSLVTSTLVGPNILLSTLFSNIHSPCFCLNLIHLV